MLSAVRVVVATVAFLVFSGSAVATSATHPVTLRSVERVFYQARIPFSQEWQLTRPNPYLVGNPYGSPSASLPKGIGLHLVGSAWYINSSTSKSRTAYVLDSASVAATYRSWIAHHCNCQGFVYLLARNVVYVGSRSTAVKNAMAQLTR
jgi:hypothetical protein